jgi:hypothetical protein
MTDWAAGPPLGDDTARRIGVDGIDGSADANSGFCATLLAMASHELRQPLQVIVSAHDVLARIFHRSAAQAQLARVKDATRQLADKACCRARAASAAGDEHATAAKRAADGALSAGSTLPRPGAGASTRSPQELPSGREVAAAWLLCLHRGACARGDKRTPQQRTARRHRGQQHRDPMAHAGSLHAGIKASQAAVERENEIFRSLTWQQRNPRRGSQLAFAPTLALPASAGRE